MSSPNGRARGRHDDAIVIGSGHDGLIGPGYLAPPRKHTLSLYVQHAPTTSPTGRGT